MNALPFPIAMVALAFFRLTPIFLVMPVLHYARVPMMVRVIITITIAILVAATSGTKEAPLTVLSLIMEFVLGVALAFSFHIAAAALLSAGKLIDVQSGLSAAAVLNPATEHTDSTIGEILSVALILTFLSVDGQQTLILAFATTIQVVPLGMVHSLPLQSIIAMTGKLFSAGFVLAAPVIVALWLTDFAMAIASKAMPQANIYFIALPIKLIIALFALSTILTSVHTGLLPLLNAIFDSWAGIAETSNG